MLLGIEIGGTKLQLGLGRGDGTIARMVTIAADPSGGAPRIRSQILEAFRGMDVRPSSVGVGFGGPVDAERGVVLTSHQVSEWDNFPLADWIRAEFGTRSVVVQNDADTAALGEAKFGAGKGLSPILYVNSGSGIGGGLIVDGRIYRGADAGAIEIGHLIMDDAHHSLESLASGWAIAAEGRRAAVRELQQGRRPQQWLDLVDDDPEKVTTLTVGQSARRSPDGEAARILARSASVMARALAHAVTLLAPRRVILGGGVSLLDPSFWLDPIRQGVVAGVFAPFRGSFDVVTAALGQDVVIHGALAIAHDALGSTAQNGGRIHDGNGKMCSS